MAVKYINQSKVDKSVEGEVVIVNAFATWCGPCKMIAPVLDDISNELNVFKVDIDQNSDFVKKYEIKGVPTTLFFKDGSLKGRIIGFAPKDEILAKLNKL